jgi:hypothetical protein
VVDAEYTDGGGGGQDPLTTHDQSILQPKHRQAEHFSVSADGVKTADVEGAEGGKAVTGLVDGQWIAFDPYLAEDVAELGARVKGGVDGAALEVRAGAPDGDVLGTVGVGTGDGWRDVTAAVQNAPSGTTKLYLVATGGSGFDLDSFTVTTK